MAEQRRPRKPRLQGTVRLSADGIAKVLGDLEARLMHVVWKLGEPATARTVHEQVIEEHPVALHTVITVLNKLVDKQLLVRRRKDQILHYSARLSAEEFLEQVSRQVVEGILSLGPQAVAASFVDVLAEQDPAQLGELLALIQRRMREEA